LKLADQSWKEALSSDSGFLEDLNVHKGKVTCDAIAETVGMDYTPREDVL